VALAKAMTTTTKPWVKVLFGVVIGMLVLAVFLLLAAQ
jgi:hypothetical protein